MIRTQTCAEENIIDLNNTQKNKKKAFVNEQI